MASPCRDDRPAAPGFSHTASSQQFRRNSNMEDAKKQTAIDALNRIMELELELELAGW